jgi:chromosome segregation ATPase
VASGADDTGPAGEGLVERVDGIAAWINDLDARVRAAELATTDEKTARELRRTVEALSKHDPKLEKRLTNRVDVLADRLATLAATVSTTAASLVRKDGEIAALRKDLEEGSKRLDALVREFGKSAGAAEVEKLRAAIRAVQAERPARTSNARVDDLSAKVAYLGERVDTLAKTVATTAAGLAGREGELATLRQRLDEGSARLEQARAELRRMQGDGALARRVDALQEALNETKTALAGRETEVVALRSRIDEAYARVGTVVAELQGSLTTLSSEVRALEELPATTEQALDAQAAELGARVDDVAGRVTALATSVETALSGLGEREAEIGALSQRVDEAGARVELVAAELREALAQLPPPGTVAGEAERRFEELGGSVAALTEQVTALVATSSAHSEANESRAAALERLVADAGERLQALETARDAVAERIEQTDTAWSQERELVRTRIEELAVADAQALQARDELTPLLDALSERLAATERGHAAAAEQIARVSSALDAEREAVHGQLDALAATSSASVSMEDVERMVAELAPRLQSLEESSGAVASEIVRVSAALDAEKETLHAQLDEVVAALAEAKATSTLDAETERALGTLTARLQSVEEGGTKAAAEIARLSTSLDAERESLRAQLDGIAAALAGSNAQAAGPDESSKVKLTELEERLRSLEDAEAEQPLAELPRRVETIERDRQSVAAELDALEMRLGEVADQLSRVEARLDARSTSADDVAQLRVAVDGLRMRLASNEQELASRVGTRDTGSRLDEVTRRLEALERAPVVVAGAGDALPGDGRFRLELRALELRMEHAEAAARENREAVLVQLERLAARIEWRFQRLEAEYEAANPEAVGGGQVVPLRPTEP